jgi:hypothetical protein
MREPEPGSYPPAGDRGWDLARRSCEFGLDFEGGRHESADPSTLSVSVPFAVRQHEGHQHVADEREPVEWKRQRAWR